MNSQQKFLTLDLEINVRQNFGDDYLLNIDKAFFYQYLITVQYQQMPVSPQRKKSNG